MAWSGSPFALHSNFGTIISFFVILSLPGFSPKLSHVCTIHIKSPTRVFYQYTLFLPPPLTLLREFLKFQESLSIAPANSSPYATKMRNTRVFHSLPSFFYISPFVNPSTTPPRGQLLLFMVNPSTLSFLRPREPTGISKSLLQRLRVGLTPGDHIFFLGINLYGNTSCVSNVFFLKKNEKYFSRKNIIKMKHFIHIFILQKIVYFIGKKMFEKYNIFSMSVFLSHWVHAHPEKLTWKNIIFFKHFFSNKIYYFL